MNVSCGWLAHPLPEPGSDHSFASSYSSYAKKILASPGMGLSISFHCSRFLVAYETIVLKLM